MELFQGFHQKIGGYGENPRNGDIKPALQFITPTGPRMITKPGIWGEWMESYCNWVVQTSTNRMRWENLYNCVCSSWLNAWPKTHAMKKKSHGWDVLLKIFVKGVVKKTCATWQWLKITAWRMKYVGLIPCWLQFPIQEMAQSINLSWKNLHTLR